MSRKRKLGEILVEAGIIDKTQLASALGQQRQWGGKLGSTLIKMGMVREKELVSVLEEQLGLKSVSLKDAIVPDEVMKFVRPDIVRKFGIFPLAFTRGALEVATSDPTDLEALDSLGFALGKRIKPVLALESEVRKAIQRFYGDGEGGGKVHTVDRDSLPKAMEILRFTKGESAQNGQIKLSQAFNALVSLLEEKGLITRRELLDRINRKQR
ncbi:MAG: hypothetical protein Kow0025_03440 [Thermodesulfovibrionales bacterium]